MAHFWHFLLWFFSEVYDKIAFLLVIFVMSVISRFRIPISLLGGAKTRKRKKISLLHSPLRRVVFLSRTPRASFFSIWEREKEKCPVWPTPIYPPLFIWLIWKGWGWEIGRRDKIVNKGYVTKNYGKDQKCICY